LAGKLTVTDGGGALVTLVTCPDRASADRLADTLVEARAAACVNIVPGLTSVYRWKGEICRDAEFLLVIKTAQVRRELVAQILSEHHPYEEPELLFLPVHSGSATYLEWLGEQVKV
jgi:periplasmic divalent cation tolerance protein